MSYFALILAIALSVAFLLGVAVLWWVTRKSRQREKRQREWARKQYGDK